MDKTDNELIAEFMGWRRAGDSEDGVFHKGQWYHTTTYENMPQSEDIPYGTSWDWLMSVLEKIYSLGLENSEILMSEAYYNLLKYSIVADHKVVYMAVVEFIKWYNEKVKHG